MTIQLIEPLTSRELEILQAQATGQTNQEIADSLFLAHSTVKWYNKQIYSKLGLDDSSDKRSDALNMARELGLLTEREFDVAKIKHNLPYQTTPFVGRDAELDDLHALLESADVRLLTILAPGGMGKTRIALEAAEQQLDNYPNGVYFVALQQLSDPEHILSQIATSTGYPFSNDGRDPRQQVLDYLANKRMLLVLDNFEHLLQDLSVVTDILRAAPNVKLIVTSREKLNLSSATIYTLRGMTFAARNTVAEILTDDAMQLLMQAAKRVRSDWELTAANLESAVKICQLTEGMPLAILLAMTWLDVLTLDEIVAEIQQSVDFLATDVRDVPDRQRSIRAIFDATWARLQPEEQDVFMKLNVFRGGFTRKAAENVTEATIRVLQGLMNKSLILRDKQGRYDVHELLRQYAEEKLEHANESQHTRNAHAQHYADWMYEHEAYLKDHRQLEGMNNIEIEFENVRAAWRWSVQHILELALLRMVDGLGLFIRMRYRHHEGKILFSNAFTILSNTPSVTPLLLAKVQLYWAFQIQALGDSRQAENLYRDCLRVFHQFDMKVETTICMFYLTSALVEQGMYAPALQQAQEGLRSAHATNDNWHIAWAHHVLGNVIKKFGKFEEGNQHHFQSLSLFSDLGDKLRMAWAHHSIVFGMAELGYAEELFQHNLYAHQLYSQVGDQRGIAGSLNNLGAIAEFRGDYEMGERHYRDALALHRDINNLHGIAWVLSNLSNILFNKGLFDEVEQLVIENRSITQTLKNPVLTADVLTRLSRLTGVKEDYIEAYRLALEAFDHAQSFVDRSAKSSTNFCLGWALCGIGAYDEAISHLVTALDLQVPFGDITVVLNSVAALAHVIAHHGQPARAAELLGLVFEHPIQLRWLELHPLVTQLRHDLQAALGEAVFSAAWERGKTLDLETVMQELLDEFSS